MEFVPGGSRAKPAVGRRDGFKKGISRVARAN